VSRILRRFQEAGVILVDQREVEVIDPGKLKNAARNVLRD